MALTPILAEAVTIGQVAEEQTAIQTSRTYKVDFTTRRVVGFTDGRDALKQAIYKIIQTERFSHLIYSWAYGFEGNRLFGKSQPEVKAEAQRLITEALTADDRISGVQGFSVEFPSKRSAAVSFTAVSIFGDIDITTEVTV